MNKQQIKEIAYTVDSEISADLLLCEDHLECTWIYIQLVTDDTKRTEDIRLSSN